MPAPGAGCRTIWDYAHGGSHLALSHAADLALGLLAAYLFTNFTSQETYARFGYVLSVLALASLAALPGVDTAVLYAAAKGNDAALAHGTRLRLKSSLLGTLAMLAWAAALASIGRSAEAAVVAWCSLLVPLIYPFSTVFSHLQGKKRFAEYALANVAIETAKTLAVAAAVLILGLDGIPVILAPFLVMAGGYLLLTAIYQAGIAGEVGPEFGSIGRTLTGSAVIATVAGQFDRLIVGTFFSPASMAAYNLGFTLTSPLRGFGSLAGRLLFPQVVRSDATAPLFRRKYGLGLLALAMGLVTLVVAFWMLFPRVQPLLFPGYEASVPITRWLIVATALGIFDTVAAQALWGLKDLRAVYLTQTAFPIQRIVLLALGAAWQGVPGILAAQVAHYALSALTIVGLWLGVSARRRNG